MSEHTPGKWPTPFQIAGYHGDRDMRITLTKGGPPEYRGDYVTVYGPNAHANAGYIHRACNAHEDLLAACEAGHDALDEGCRDCALVDRRGDVDECPIKHCLALPAQATLRAAIAKAKGE